MKHVQGDERAKISNEMQLILFYLLRSCCSLLSKVLLGGAAGSWDTIGRESGSAICRLKSLFDACFNR